MLDLERSLQTLKAAACVLNLGANITERVRALRWSFFNPPQPQTRRALVSQEPCLEGDRLPRPGTRKEPRPGGPPDSSSPRTPPRLAPRQAAREGKGRGGGSTHIGSLGRLHRHGAGRREGAAAWERNTGRERAAAAATRRSPQRRTRMLSQPAPRLRSRRWAGGARPP